MSVRAKELDLFTEDKAMSRAVTLAQSPVLLTALCAKGRSVL